MSVAGEPFASRSAIFANGKYASESLLACHIFSKVNMVDIAQLVSASDCGSEGRGFESHYPPHKITPSAKRRELFYGDNGIRKAVKKTCRWHVFRPWENPFLSERIPLGCGMKGILFVVLYFSLACMI